MLSTEFALFVQGFNQMYQHVQVLASSKPREGVSCYVKYADGDVLFGFDCVSEEQAQGVIQLLATAGEFKALGDIQEKLSE